MNKQSAGLKSKKYLNIAILALIAVVSGYAGFSYWLVQRQNQQPPSEQLSKDSHHDQKKETYYCPMHPHVQSDKPGQRCHICGMNLIPMPQGDKAPNAASEEGNDPTTDSDLAKVEDRGTVFLSPSRKQLIGVVETVVEERPLFRTIRAPGRVAFDPDLYIVKSEYIEALKQWNKVRNSPLEEVRRSTQEMVRSSRIRLKVLGLSDKQIQEIGPNSRDSENLLLGQKGKDAWIYAEVFESDLELIESGNSVEITAPFLSGKTLPGQVIAVDNLINPESRTGRVRIQLKEKGVALRPESFVTATIFCPMGTHLSVPRDAILDSGRESFVYRVDGGGHYSPVPVKVSFWTDHYVAIGGGLKPGDKIVRRGNFMVDSEARLMGVLQSVGN